MRSRMALAAIGGVAFGLLVAPWSGMKPVMSQEAPGSANRSADEADLKELKAAAADFEKAYNGGDAKAIAAQFTDDAEAVDEDGNVVKGRANIEARFADIFKNYPKARIAVELTSLRQLSGNIAVEDGDSTTTLSPDEPGSRSPYTVIHVKRDGKWLVASVRDFPEEATSATAHEQLRALEWLVGHWVDESPEGRVETNCRWSKDGNYLLQDYTAKLRFGPALSGTQRIAWDPQQHTIRSWSFDKNGSFTEATWTPLDDSWILKAQGVTPDGHGVSVTRRLIPISNDSYQIDSTSLVVGEQLIPDQSVRVVRRPPAPIEQ